MEKLIIVGNGFDLAHGLKTSYKNFAGKNKDNPYIVSFRNLFDNMKENSGSLNVAKKRKNNVTWYDFEENIENISSWVFAKNYRDDLKKEDFKELEEKMACVNNVFKHISELLVSYLIDEISGKKIEKIKSIEKEITPDSHIISFNYTDTIKMYTNNYNFVHGSISDDNGSIILGFPRNDFSELSTDEYIKYDKDILREKLNFLRFLRKNNYKEEEKLLKEFEVHLYCLFSGKGGYDFPAKSSSNGIIYDMRLVSDPIKKYAMNNNFLPAKDKNDYSNVREVVIMGHGLEADLYFIESIFKKAKSLEVVKLFTYEGEPDSSISRKKKTLKKISRVNNIEVCQY